jgi:hypothetical protein
VLRCCCVLKSYLRSLRRGDGTLDSRRHFEIHSLSRNSEHPRRRIHNIPCAYWPAPKGTRVVVAGYVYSFGDVLTDPSLSITGVNSKINSVVLAYLQTLSLWGCTANFVVELPHVWGTTQGSLEKDPTNRELSGLGDLRITPSVKLCGAPSIRCVNRNASFPASQPRVAVSV